MAIGDCVFATIDIRQIYSLDGFENISLYLLNQEAHVRDIGDDMSECLRVRRVRRHPDIETNKPSKTHAFQLESFAY